MFSVKQTERKFLLFKISKLQVPKNFLPFQYLKKTSTNRMISIKG